MTQTPGPDAADVGRLLGNHGQLIEEHDAAKQMYTGASEIISKFEASFGNIDGIGYDVPPSDIQLSHSNKTSRS